MSVFFVEDFAYMPKMMQGDSHRPVTSTQLAHSRKGFCHQGVSLMMVLLHPPSLRETILMLYVV